MKYILEDNINFFEELKNELLNPIEKTNQEDKVCLLTNMALEDNFITLDCSHKFNYEPLFHEVCNQKLDNNLETTHLYINEIKCPYCRNITPKLLPYIPKYSCILKKGVNTPLKYCIKLFECSWKIKSGKNKNNLCSNPAFKSDNGIYCNFHHKVINFDKKNDCNCPIIPVEISEKYLEISKKHTIVSLKNKLRENKLKISGTKSMLINRLIVAGIL